MVVTGISLVAVTDDLIGRVVGVTGVAVEVFRARVPGAGAGPAVFPGTQDWAPEEPVHTPGAEEKSVG